MAVMAMVAQFLVDTSALARYPCPAVAARLDELSAAGVVATCGVVELQLLSALQDVGTYATVAAMRRNAFTMLETTEADVRRALEVQGLLTERGEFSVPWPALIIAAVAERHGVTVLHYDACFDVIVEVTGQGMEWVAALRT
jgi:Predicted nucleic acid-binding protein, contains PIN domain